MTEQALFPDIRIVLVETTHAGNIGAAARAMKNMGITRLYLVQPRDFPDEKAIWRAAGAADVVEAARVVDSLDDAIAGCRLVIGTSARDRRIPWPMLDPGECGVKVNEALGGKGDVAILFGRESRGLRNEELQKCHYHVNIPTAKAYSSLNLAMAVQVITWEVLRASLEGKPRPQAWDVDYASAEAVEHFFEHLERTLIQVDFHDPENPRQLMTRLRRLFNRVRMDEMEVNILRGFLTAINKLEK
jgi:tRNA (cytidine32/uridine32-2'-O)-methyltransferase